MSTVYSFFAFMPSNDLSFPENKISNFKTHLAKPLNLSEEWEVGMTSISYTKSWDTFRNSSVTVRFLPGMSTEYDIPVSLQNQHFENETEMVNYINWAVEKEIEKFESKGVRNIFSHAGFSFASSPPKLIFEPESNKYTMQAGVGKHIRSYVIDFEGEISNIVGLPEIKKFDFWEFAESLFEVYDKFPQNEAVAKPENVHSAKQLLTELHQRIKSGESYNTFIKILEDQLYVDNIYDKTSNDNLAQVVHAFFEDLYLFNLGGPSDIIVVSKDMTHWKNPFKLQSVSSSLISTLYKEFYVYCDIIMPSFLGNTYSKILRIVDVPSKVPFGRNIVTTFTDPYYFPLAVTEFQTIEIHIKDEFDENIPFGFGTCIVTLHFRKRK